MVTLTTLDKTCFNHQSGEKKSAVLEIDNGIFNGMLLTYVISFHID